MSSNQQHINISLSNYEEYFLLYLDGEMGETGMQQVEQFVSLHPHLQEEFDLLLTTKLDGEELVFDHKEQLLSYNMKVNAIDESLLLFIDDELSPSEKNQVEKKLEEDGDYRFQYQLLSRVKLNAQENVAYPNKKELYRHTERRIVPMIWYRVAVAVVLLLGVVFFWQNIEPSTTPTDIALKPADKQQPPVNQNKKLQPTPLQPAVEEVNDNLVAYEQTLKPATSTTKKVSDKNQTTPQNILAVPDTRDRTIAYHDVPNDADEKNKGVELLQRQQQIINNDAVTTNTQPAYTTIDAAATTESMVSNAVVLSNDEKKGSIRGFLRKASRFIERRTGINPVNDDDELLIAAVALKLK